MVTVDMKEARVEVEEHNANRVMDTIDNLVMIFTQEHTEVRQYARRRRLA